MQSLQSFVNEAKIKVNKNDTYSLANLEPFEMNILITAIEVALSHKNEVDDHIDSADLMKLYSQICTTTGWKAKTF